MFSRTVAASAGALMLALLPAPAGAVISDVEPIDGPSADIVELGGTAMSDDGTGGLVYLKREAGRNHVFAAQFVNGDWRAPQRVDVGQAFDSSWARIGAGDDGRLVVTWVQEFGPGTDRMFSASLDPGASRFQRPIPFDFNLGEATATFPSLAMARGGAAYLTYRVVTSSGSESPPGFLGADVRVARYGGSLWSVIGSVADRNPSVPVRNPTETNSPKVGIDIEGRGVIAFQEPDDDFIDRIYARRLFGSSMGIPQAVSPTTFEGAPLRGPADSFSLDVGGFGLAAVAFRQQPGEGGRLGSARTFINQLPDVFSETSGAFGGARIADGAPLPSLGPPSVAVNPNTDYLLGLGSQTTTLGAAGNEETVGPVQRLDSGGNAIPADPQVDLAETGAGVAAWKDQRGGRGAVMVQERRADGVPETAPLSAPRGGAVNTLRVAGSGQGDAIIGFRQGGGSFGQIAATVVDAPPSDFFIVVPDTWQRKRLVPLSWDRSQNGVSGVTYSVAVDDEPVKQGLRRRSARLGPAALGDGVHRIQIFALDGAGQETGSKPAKVKVDRTRPRVRVRRRGPTVSVRVSDGARGQASLLRRSAIRISFGDGKGRSGKPRASHRYRRRGVYRLKVLARDRAGNSVSVNRRVRIR